jgi:predicted enzyme related to lactoylglutathione lyase
MSGSDDIGKIGWLDMTTEDAPGVRDFYKAVVGWGTEESAAACLANGGKIVVEPRGLAGGRFCVIEDPGRSIAALYQP